MGTRTRGAGVAGVLVVLLAATAGCQEAGDVTLAIEGVTVLPMTGAGALTDRTVLVAGDRIVEVGPSSNITVPEGAERIDGTGRYLVPGLVDAHVHLMDVNDLPLLLSRGITSVLNMAGAPLQLGWRSRIEAGDLAGPRLFTTGPQLKVEADPLVDFERAVGTPEMARALVATQAEMGYDFVKIWGPLAPDVYAAVMDAANQAGIRVTGHIPRDVGLAGALQAGQSSFAHVEEYWNKVFGRRPDRGRIPAVAERSAGGGVHVISTLVTYEAIAASVADDPAPLLNMPERQLLDPVRRLLWEPGLNRYRTPGRTGEGPQYLAALEFEQHILRGLHEVGVPILAGSDAGEIPGLVPGVSLHRELELMVDAGLAPLEALAAATAHPGRYLAPDVPGMGTVAEGAPADLVLLGSDPRVAIGATRDIEAVIARGRIHDPDSLEASVHAANRNTGPFVEHVMAGDLGAASDYARMRAAAGDPPAMTPMLFMAYVQAERGDAEGAGRLLELTAEVHPDSYLPRYMLGVAALGAGDTEAAVDAFRQALDRAPNHDAASAILEQIRR